MGGIVIDIWEKSNFFSSFGLQKGAKKTIFVQGVGALKAPPNGRVNRIRVFEGLEQIRSTLKIPSKAK